MTQKKDEKTALIDAWEKGAKDAEGGVIQEMIFNDDPALIGEDVPGRPQNIILLTE